MESAIKTINAQIFKISQEVASNQSILELEENKVEELKLQIAGDQTTVEQLRQSVILLGGTPGETYQEWCEAKKAESQLN